VISTDDPVFARRMLERAIAMQTTPTLDTAAVNDLMAIAVTTGTGGDPDIYTGADLNRAASIGWQWKDGLTSNQYDLGGGERKLTRSQWNGVCRRNAADYATGFKTVIGDGGRRSGVGSIQLVSSMVDTTGGTL